MVEDNWSRDPEDLGDLDKVVALHAEKLAKLELEEVWSEQDSDSDCGYVEAFYVSEENSQVFLADTQEGDDVVHLFDGDETDGLPVLKMYRGQPFRKKFLKGRKGNPKEYQRRKTQFKQRGRVFRSNRGQPRKTKGHCWAYQKTGRCPNGASCKFKHVKGSGKGTRKSTSKGKSKGGRKSKGTRKGKGYGKSRNYYAHDESLEDEWPADEYEEEEWYDDEYHEETSISQKKDSLKKKLVAGVSGTNKTSPRPRTFNLLPQHLQSLLLVTRAKEKVKGRAKEKARARARASHGVPVRNTRAAFADLPSTGLVSALARPRKRPRSTKLSGASMVKWR